MPVYQFSLLIQSAGTFFLFVLFLLLYQKIHRRAFLEWIASWAFLLISLCIQLVFANMPQGQRPFLFLLNLAQLAHAVFLLRGVRRFRDERAGSSSLELLWIVPVIAIAWLTSVEAAVLPGRAAEPGRAAMALVLAAAYATAAIAFTITQGSAAGRALLSSSLLLWGVSQAVMASAYTRGGPASWPEPLQYMNFGAIFFEMMIAVGIIILLFEVSQRQLATEMRQLQDSEQQLKEMGVRDPLTGLYNRHHFNDVIRRELANVRRYGISLSVLLVDVDSFKQINDIKGHAVGDEVLVFVANYLTGSVRESDFVFRWGGDEFLILLPRTDEGSAAQKAEELAGKMPVFQGTGELPVALSVGWATHRMDAEFPMTLSQADARMYEMKVRNKKEREEREKALPGGAGTPRGPAGP
jgi:diguanylate cyclase (GGDEF)-like protein